MLQIPYAASEQREYQLGAPGIPLNIAAGGTGIVTASFTVPEREVNQVIASGGTATVDNVLVTCTGAYVAVQSQQRSMITSVRVDANANYVNGGSVVPMQVNTIAGLLRVVFSLSLQGVMLQGGDSVLLLMNFQNADAVARNVTQFGWQTRVVPALVVTEQAVALLDGIRGDQSLNQRLIQRR